MEKSAPLLDEKKCARWLGMSVFWLQRARLTGLGPPYIRLGRSVRYRPEDLREWTERRRRTSTSEERRTSTSDPGGAVDEGAAPGRG